MSLTILIEKPMRTLSIDIGTNSTLYLIADIEADALRVVERGIVANRLGASKEADGSLRPDVIDANREILARMLARGDELACVRVKAVGTHALRSAKNSHDYLAMTASLGLDLQIIDGREEAALAWRGVVGSSPSSKRLAILDIGGGSSELIVGKGASIEYSHSIPIGAVTLTGRFRSDPPAQPEVAAAEEEIAEAIKIWAGVVPASCPLIGIAGTCTSLASLQMKIVDYNPGLIEGFRLSQRRIIQWKNRLLQMDCDTRIALPGMPPARAAIIPAGAMILDLALQIIGKKSVIVSEKGLIFGLAWQLAGY